MRILIRRPSSDGQFKEAFYVKNIRWPHEKFNREQQDQPEGAGAGGGVCHPHLSGVRCCFVQNLRRIFFEVSIRRVIVCVKEVFSPFVLSCTRTKDWENVAFCAQSWDFMDTISQMNPGERLSHAVSRNIPFNESHEYNISYKHKKNFLHNIRLSFSKPPYFTYFARLPGK